MASVGFGSGTARRQWYLPGIDPALLPAAPVQGVPPVADAITASFVDPVAGTTLFDDRVAVAATSIDGQAGLGFTTTDVANAVLLGDAGLAARFAGFTHVDAQLGNGASVLHLVGVQRANLITGDGDDVLRIDTLRSNRKAEQDYRVVTGDGDDVVRIGAASRRARPAVSANAAMSASAMAMTASWGATRRPMMSMAARAGTRSGAGRATTD